MEHNVAKHLAGVLVVARQLGATIVVVPRMDGIHALAPCLLLQQLHQLLGNAIHTPHGGHNPHLVADSHFAIPPDVSLEGHLFVGDGERLVDGVVFVGERTREVGLQVVLVHPTARFQSRASMSDGIAVFDDILALSHVLQQNLVAGWRVLEQRDGATVHLDSLALFHRTQAHHHRVGGIDFDKTRLFHVDCFVTRCMSYNCVLR